MSNPNEDVAIRIADDLLVRLVDDLKAAVAQNKVILRRLRQPAPE